MSTVAAFRCRDCGEHVERPGSRGPIPRRCAGCTAERQERARRERRRRARDARTARCWTCGQQSAISGLRAGKYTRCHRCVDAMVKRCSCCGDVKAVEEYHSHSGTEDGLRLKCRPCRSIDKASYNDKNREAIRAANAAWRAANRESARQMEAEWRRANPERARAAERAWAKANMDRRRDALQRYRARKREAFVADVERALIWERDSGICGICDEPADPADWHLDHIVPLAVGGAHEPSNTQVSHPSCNVRKGARMM